MQVARFSKQGEWGDHRQSTRGLWPWGRFTMRPPLDTAHLPSHIVRTVCVHVPACLRVCVPARHIGPRSGVASAARPWQGGSHRATAPGGGCGEGPPPLAPCAQALQHLACGEKETMGHIVGRPTTCIVALVTLRNTAGPCRNPKEAPRALAPCRDENTRLLGCLPACLLLIHTGGQPLHHAGWSDDGSMD